ncbi:hypothetical protein LPJ73_002121, partial [Coemansia sp. RSA 2703]
SNMASLETLTRLSEPSIQGAQRAREIIKKAKESLEESKKDYRAICDMHPKLAFMLSENESQMQVCRRLESNLKRQLNDLETMNATKSQQAAEAQRELAMVIELLQSREVVEKEFRSPHPVGGSTNEDGSVNEPKKHTLYDHIDQDAVDVLEKTIADCLEQMGRLVEVDGRICAEALGDISKVDIPAAEEISVTWEGVKAIGTLVSESQAAVDEITQDSQSMDHHCDQLRDSIRDLEADGGVLSSEDYNVLLRDTNEIPAIVEDMNEALLDIQRRSEETHVRSLQYSAFYSDSQRQFDGIAQISQIIDGYLNSTSSSQAQFSQLLEKVEQSLGDIWGLVSWYRGFHNAYDALIGEVRRRRQAQKAMHAVVEDMRSRLEAVHMEEVKERAAFVDRFGPFLPSDLCPFIQDPPVQFVVEEVGDAERFASVQSHETRYSKLTVASGMPEQ